MRKKKIFNDKGFTLIELVVAVTVLSIVITIVAEAFWIAQRSYEKGRDIMDVRLREYTVFDLVTKQLNSAFPFALKEKEAVFVGNAENIDFITTLPMGLEKRAGLFYVSYALEESPQGPFKILKAYQRPFYTREPLGTNDQKNGFMLLSGIKNASWSYYLDGEWVDEFEGENGRLPQMVMLRLAYVNDGHHEKLQPREIVISVIAEKKRRESHQAMRRRGSGVPI